MTRCPSSELGRADVGSGGKLPSEWLVNGWQLSVSSILTLKCSEIGAGLTPEVGFGSVEPLLTTGRQHRKPCGDVVSRHVHLELPKVIIGLYRCLPTNDRMSSATDGHHNGPPGSAAAAAVPRHCGACGCSSHRHCLLLRAGG